MTAFGSAVVYTLHSCTFTACKNASAGSLLHRLRAGIVIGNVLLQAGDLRSLDMQQTTMSTVPALRPWVMLVEAENTDENAIPQVKAANETAQHKTEDLNFLAPLGVTHISKLFCACCPSKINGIVNGGLIWHHSKGDRAAGKCAASA